MRITEFHPWDIDIKEALSCQKLLKSEIDTASSLEIKNVKRVAGADVAYTKDNWTYGAVVVLSFPRLNIVEEAWVKLPLAFRYLPGFLAFREGPVLLRTFKKVRQEPDVIFFDGQGIAHPQRIGLASHLGLFLKKPTIGVAKTPLTGNYQEPEESFGSWSFITKNHEVLGMVLRTREKTKPLFISPGHKIDWKSSIEVTLKCLKRHKSPEPLRLAHLLSRRLSRNEL